MEEDYNKLQRQGQQQQLDEEDEQEVPDGDNKIEEVKIRFGPGRKKKIDRRRGPRKGDVKLPANRRMGVGGGMSVERWIFYEGLRLGNSNTIEDYLNVLSERVLQVMPREELIMFYNNLMVCGGYMAVQARKKWPVIVKMCNFAQTTSSSYSTRNKYESYLLAKEEHDYLCAAVGMSARSVSWGLASLAQLCVCHYEQVEAQSSKKNLLMPLIEMLSHDLPALQRLLHHLDSPVTTDDVTNALLILRGLTSKKLQSLLGPAVTQAWATLFPSLTKLIGRSLKDSSKSEGVVIASILLVVGVSHREPLSEEDCKLFADLLMSVLENCVQVVYLGRSLVNRICNAPVWLLRALSLPRLLAQVKFSLDSMDKSFNDLLVKIPRNLLRLLCKVLMKLDPLAPVEGLNDTQPAWEAVMTHLMAFGSADALVEAPVRVSVQAALRALCEYRPQLSQWVKENLSVTDITDIAAVDDDDSSEERRNAKGKRRAVSAVGRPRKNFPMKSDEPKRRITGAEQPERKDGDHRHHNDDDDDGDEEPYNLKGLSEDQRINRMKRERERARSKTVRQEHERYRLAAEPRERAAPKRPRKPILPIGRETELVLQQQQQLIQQQQQRELQQQQPQQKRLRAVTNKIPPPSAANDPNPLLVNLQLENCVLEGRLEERETAIYGLETEICVLQGNARFWNGLASSYSQNELFLVRANAIAVLSRLDSAVAMPGPLHTCLVCNEKPASHFLRGCMCLVYCELCLPTCPTRCVLCGLK